MEVLGFFYPAPINKSMRGALLYPSEFTPYSTTPVCNEELRQCEIWVPAAAFGLASNGEKVLAAKMYGNERGEDGWEWAREIAAEKPGWIVVRRKIPDQQ